MAVHHTGNQLHLATHAPARAGKREIHITPLGAFVGIGMFWMAYFALMAIWPGTLERIWANFLDLQLAIRIIVGALFLPFTLATWVWQGGWSTTAQVLAIAMIVLVTMVLFRPSEQE